MNLEARNLKFRLVEVSDAEFILSLRLDPRYNEYLSKVNSSIEKQRDWIEGYKKDEGLGRQFYFLIERKDDTPCGTVRLYDFRDESFSWGSWILNDKKPRFAALESALLVYEFGFDKLGYKKSHFEVLKGNIGVIKFHLRMGAKKVSEDENSEYFEITKENLLKSKDFLLTRIS